MKYQIGMWNGCGYHLSQFIVEGVFSIEEALEKVVAMVEEQGRTDLFFDEMEELETMEDEGLVLYVDATMHGGGCHWIDSQNLSIKEINE